jgi:glutamate-ammonia-ligase adenylyltransferase
MDELVKIFGTSLFLSRTLIDYPESLDILLSSELTHPRKDKVQLKRELERLLSVSGDYEDRLDTLRRFRNLEIFRIGTNDIIGELTSSEVSDQITALAEVSIDEALIMAYAELEKRYGSSEAAFAVVGMGKLGGMELVYGSDLDIIFVYSNGSKGAAKGVTTGPRVVSDHEFFVHLAQKIISILTVRTKEGLVFNVDTRLRPSGSAGPLVVSTKAFINYHKFKAAPWEKLAALKARAVAGDPGFCQEVLKELEKAVYKSPPAKQDIKELMRIRKRMEEELAKETPTRFNVKTGKGGLVDIEFLVQTLQLLYAPGDASLRTPHILMALEALGKAGIIGPEDLSELRHAYSLRLRVVHDKPEAVLDSEKTAEIKKLAKRLGYTGVDAGGKFLSEYRRCSENVRRIYLEDLQAMERLAQQ